MAARLRHIALSVRDLARSQKFFEDAFGMTRVGEGARGVYMTDGTINLALLDRKGRPDSDALPEPFYGILHFGMWVDDTDETLEKVKQAGGAYLSGNVSDNPKSFFEVKCTDPDGAVFDLSHNGWNGAVKEVAPLDGELADGEKADGEKAPA